MSSKTLVLLALSFGMCLRHCYARHVFLSYLIWQLRSNNGPNQHLPRTRRSHSCSLARLVARLFIEMNVADPAGSSGQQLVKLFVTTARDNASTISFISLRSTYPTNNKMVDIMAQIAANTTTKKKTHYSTISSFIHTSPHHPTDHPQAHTTPTSKSNPDAQKTTPTTYTSTVSPKAPSASPQSRASQTRASLAFSSP